MVRMTDEDRERAMEEYILQIQRVKKNAQAVVLDLEDLERRASAHRAARVPPGPPKPPG